MTKTDFAELKEMLCRKIYVDIYVQREHDTAIISELIEIIQSQSEALELSTNLLHNAYYEIDDDTDEYKEICIKNRECTIQTTTRLQKLRDGNNGNTTN